MALPYINIFKQALIYGIYLFLIILVFYLMYFFLKPVIFNIMKRKPKKEYMEVIEKNARSKESGKSEPDRTLEESTATDDRRAEKGNRNKEKDNDGAGINETSGTATEYRDLQSRDSAPVLPTKSAFK